MKLSIEVVISSVGVSMGACCMCMAQGWTSGPAFPATDPNSGRLYAVGLNRDGRLIAIGGQPFAGGDQNGTVNYLDEPYSGGWQDGGMLEGLGSVLGQGGGIDNLNRCIVFGGWDPFDGNAAGECAAYDLDDPNNTQGLASLPAGVPWMNISYATDDAHLVYGIGGGPGAAATTGNPNRNTCVRYTGTTDSWQTMAAMTSAVADAAAVNDGQGHILVIGGYSQLGTRTANVARYDIASNTWSDTAVPDLPTPRSGLRAVLGSNGLIYAIGGREGAGTSIGSVTNTVHVYDAGTNAWTPGPAMARAREHFGVALGDDDHIYVMGGGGSTAAEQRETERLYTPVCPLVAPASHTNVWVNADVALAAVVTGGSPLSYQWQKEGVDIGDGPSAGGGTISGSTTTTLHIDHADSADSGNYTLSATNGCGTTIGPVTTLVVQRPPVIPTTWAVSNLHPGWAEASYAHAVTNGEQVGYGVRDIPEYNNIALASRWNGSASSCETFAGPGSVGGAFHDGAGGYAVGWWWWPYQCYISGQWYTCYTQQPCLVDEAGQFFNLQVSGWEYGLVSATDGVQHGGSVTTDDAVGNYFSAAVLWQQNVQGGYSYTMLSTPYGSPGADASVSAVYGGKQYGSWNYRAIYFDGYHTCAWTGTAESRVDLSPPSSYSSSIADAHIGQQVGSVTWGQGQGSHASIWSGTANVVDVHPKSGWASSTLTGVHGGLQVGTLTNAGVMHAAIWAGTAESVLDLHDFAPAGFAGTWANGIEISDSGVITVAGAGNNTNTGRVEALVWRSGTLIPGDINGDGTVGIDDLTAIILGWGACGSLCSADITGDGVVDINDLTIVILNWS